METATPMLLFLGFLFIGMWLMLVFSWQSAEKERKLREAADAAPEDAVAAMPRFFADLPANGGGRTAPVDQDLVAQVERFLCEERGLARKFVRAPDLESLHRGCVPARGPELIDEVTRYLAEERDLVRQFVAAPSIEFLHRLGAPAARRN